MGGAVGAAATHPRRQALIATARPTLGQRLKLWSFPGVPRGRVAVLRTFVYGFVFLDVLILRPWVMNRGEVPAGLYRPFLIARVLGLPAPTPLLVRIVMYSLLVSAAVSLMGRIPRLSGAAVFALYFEWMVIAFSYGKVDHDRLAFLVALAVLPTVGKARWSDIAADPRAGWAVRCVQVAVVLTYLFSVYAKVRFGGLEWVNSDKLMAAVLRRGTELAEPLVGYPGGLRGAQYAIVLFELASPLLLVPGRVGRMMLVVAVTFHVLTFAGIGIMFWPHVLCLLSFLPLETIAVRGRNHAVPVP